MRILLSISFCLLVAIFYSSGEVQAVPKIVCCTDNDINCTEENRCPPSEPVDTSTPTNPTAEPTITSVPPTPEPECLGVRIVDEDGNVICQPVDLWCHFVCTGQANGSFDPAKCCTTPSCQGRSECTDMNNCLDAGCDSAECCSKPYCAGKEACTCLNSNCADKICCSKEVCKSSEICDERTCERDCSGTTSSGESCCNTKACGRNKQHCPGEWCKATNCGKEGGNTADPSCCEYAGCKDEPSCDACSKGCSAEGCCDKPSEECKLECKCKNQCSPECCDGDKGLFPNCNEYCGQLFCEEDCSRPGCCDKPVGKCIKQCEEKRCEGKCDGSDKECCKTEACKGSAGCKCVDQGKELCGSGCCAAGRCSRDNGGVKGNDQCCENGPACGTLCCGGGSTCTEINGTKMCTICNTSTQKTCKQGANIWCCDKTNDCGSSYGSCISTCPKNTWACTVNGIRACCPDGQVCFSTSGKPECGASCPAKTTKCGQVCCPDATYTCENNQCKLKPTKPAAGELCPPGNAQGRRCAPGQRCVSEYVPGGGCNGPTCSPGGWRYYCQ